MTVTTSMQIVGTSSAGVMTTQAVVLASQGGTGVSVSFSSYLPGDVIQVNPAGTSFIVGAVPAAAPNKIYTFANFT